MADVSSVVDDLLFSSSAHFVGNGHLILQINAKVTTKGTDYFPQITNSLFVPSHTNLDLKPCSIILMKLT